MGRLGIAKCTVHSISSQINQEGIQCTKAKKYLRFYCLFYVPTLIEGELDPSMYTMNPTVGDTTFLPTVTTTGKETLDPGEEGGKFPTLIL